MRLLVAVALIGLCLGFPGDNGPGDLHEDDAMMDQDAHEGAEVSVLQGGPDAAGPVATTLVPAGFDFVHDDATAAGPVAITLVLAGLVFVHNGATATLLAEVFPTSPHVKDRLNNNYGGPPVLIYTHQLDDGNFMYAAALPGGAFPTAFAATGVAVPHGTMMLYLPVQQVSAYGPMLLVAQPPQGVCPTLVIHVLLDRPPTFWANGPTTQALEALVHLLGVHDVPALVLLVDQQPYSTCVRSRRSAAEGSGFTAGGFNAANILPFDTTGVLAAAAVSTGLLAAGLHALAQSIPNVVVALGENAHLTVDGYAGSLLLGSNLGPNATVVQGGTQLAHPASARRRPPSYIAGGILTSILTVDLQNALLHNQMYYHGLAFEQALQAVALLVLQLGDAAAEGLNGETPWTTAAAHLHAVAAGALCAAATINNGGGFGGANGQDAVAAGALGAAAHINNGGGFGGANGQDAVAAGAAGRASRYKKQREFDRLTIVREGRSNPTSRKAIVNEVCSTAVEILTALFGEPTTKCRQFSSKLRGKVSAYLQRLQSGVAGDGDSLKLNKMGEGGSVWITLRRSPTIAEYVALPDEDAPEAGQFNTGFILDGVESQWGSFYHNDHEGQT